MISSSISSASFHAHLQPQHHEPGRKRPEDLGERLDYPLKQEAEFGPQRCCEPAKSDRFSCKHCSGHIKQGSIRLGVKIIVQNHSSWQWFHPTCLTDRQITNIAKLGYRKAQVCTYMP